jgi:hypothetical protein
VQNQRLALCVRDSFVVIASELTYFQPKVPVTLFPVPITFVTTSTRSNMATRQLWFNLNRVGIDAISIMMKHVWKSGFYSMTMRPRCPLCR